MKDKKEMPRKRKTIYINGVEVVNSENVQKLRELTKDPTFGTEDLIWLADKDNLTN